MEGRTKSVLAIGTVIMGGIALLLGRGKSEPQKYSYNWIHNLSDKDWEFERDLIWKRWANPNQDSHIRDELWSLLQLFDKVKSNKDWAGKKPQGPAYHREHGYNLYKPD